MAVRVLLVLSGLALLCGCGQASSPVERQEQRAGVEEAQREKPKTVTPSGLGEEEPTQQVVGNIPIDAAVGEDIEADGFNLRVLDYFVTDHYYYNGGWLEEEDAFSQLGKFIVVNYSLTNTSAGTISPNFNAYLHARARSGKVEVYDPHQEITPPHAVLSPSPVGLDDLPPRQMFVSQFIFDVPRDVEAELLVVNEMYTLADPPNEVGVVDLTRSDPKGPRPEEILALQYEYTNMTAWEQAYDLFAQESKERVPRETYVSVEERDHQRDPFAITNYSFPSVEVEGDHATIERVYSWSTADEEGQDKATQEAILEDAGWRILMREDQYKYYLGGEETTL